LFDLEAYLSANSKNAKLTKQQIKQTTE